MFFSSVTDGRVRMILRLLLLLSLFVFLFHPDSFSTSYVTICFSIALIAVFFYYQAQKKDNFFDFDTIFIIILLICFFAYPVFFHSKDFDYSFFTINDNLNEKRISMATAISAIAICSYCLGAVSAKSSMHKTNVFNQIIPTKGLTLLFSVLTVFALLNGSVQYYQDLYHEGLEGAQYSRLIGQVTAITKALFFVLIGTEAYNYNNGKRKVNWLFLITALTDASLMLYAGNRTLASEYLLAIFFFVFYYKRKIRLIELLGMLVLAFMGMYFIQLFRQGVEVSSYFGIQIISDFMSPYRMNLVAIDYVDSNNYSFGVSLFGPITGIIPGFSRLLQLIGVDISFFDSASVFTTYEQGKIHTSGLGTSLQADAYLAFGVIGVIFTFYFIGKFAKVSFDRMRQGSYYYFIIYAIFIGHSVYWVRSLVFIFSNMLVWGVLIAYLNLNNSTSKRLQ